MGINPMSPVAVELSESSWPAGRPPPFDHPRRHPWWGAARRPAHRSAGREKTW